MSVSFAESVFLVEGGYTSVKAVENLCHVSGLGLQVKNVSYGFCIVEVLLFESFLLGHK
jgi:hypothetical protein